jgi:hypothetical protein
LKKPHKLAIKVDFAAQLGHDYYKMPFVRGKNETSWQNTGWLAALAVHVLQCDGNA